MRPKSNPEVDRLKEEAQKAHAQLLSVVQRLEHKLLNDEEIGQEPPEFPKPYKNGKH